MKVTDNMVFDYSDTSEPLDLQTFKHILLKQLMTKAYFQDVPKLVINMLKLPIIIAPSMLGKQVNNDVKKESLLDKNIVYKPDTFTKFSEMIDAGAIDVLAIEDMTKTELVTIGKEVGLAVADKSAVVLRNEFKNMTKHVLAGQGPCHEYKIKRNRTGGFTDVFCDHRTKVASKVQPVQESVR